MSLNTTNFIPLGPIKSADIKQFVDLFTGVMIDQPVTFKNTLLVGGSQGNSTPPLKLFGATGQVGNLIELYPTAASPNATFGFGALGNFSWGPGSPAANDTFLSRVAMQNGHVTDTAGLLIQPYLEVMGAIKADSLLFSNSATLTAPGASPFALEVNQDLNIVRFLTLGGAARLENSAGDVLANDAFIAGNGFLFIGSQKDFYVRRDGVAAGTLIGSLVVTGVLNPQGGISPNSIVTPAIAPNSVTRQFGAFLGPATFSTTNVGSWIETPIRISATVQYTSSWLQFSGHVTLQHTLSGGTAILAWGVDGNPVAAFAVMQVPAANAIQSFSWDIWTQQSAVPHRFGLFVNNSNAGTLSINTAANNIATVMEHMR